MFVIINQLRTVKLYHVHKIRLNINSANVKTSKILALLVQIYDTWFSLKLGSRVSEVQIVLGVCLCLYLVRHNNLFFKTVTFLSLISQPIKPF